MNEVEKAAVEALLFGIPPGGGRAVRIRSATLGRVPAEEVEEVATETTDQKVHRAAFAIGNAHRMETWYSSYRRPSGRIRGLDDALVSVVNTTEDSRGENYDGEYDQGSEGELTVEFKVVFNDGTEIYLQKTGYADSYGSNNNWDGPWKVGKHKTIVAYE